jgi:O-antigen/teichoic acid export membrane protein
MLKREVTVTFAGSFIGTILSLGEAVILARVLGPTDRGVLGLALLIPTIAATFCVLGQDTVNATFAGLYKDKRSSLFEQSLIIILFGSLVSTVVICAFYFWLPIKRGQFSQLTPDIIWLTCLFTPISMLSTMTISLVRGVGRITLAAVIQVVQIAALVCLLYIFLVWRGGGLKTALMLTTLSPLVAIAVSVWVLRDYITLRPSEFSGWLFKKSLGFGAQISLTAFATFLVYRLDQGILGYMVSTYQIGLYIMAVALAEKLRLLPSSIAVAFLPRLANELSSRQSQVPMVFRLTVVISVVSMLILGILGAPVILVFFGRDYSGSIPSFLLLLPGIAALGGASVLFGDLITREKPKYSIWTSYTVLIVNVILCFCLIPIMGIAGAALASTISYTLASYMAILFYQRESRVPLKEMIPRLEDVKYILSVLISSVRHIIVLGIRRL